MACGPGRGRVSRTLGGTRSREQVGTPYPPAVVAASAQPTPSPRSSPRPHPRSAHRSVQVAGDLDAAGGTQLRVLALVEVDLHAAVDGAGLLDTGPQRFVRVLLADPVE